MSDYEGRFYDAMSDNETLRSEIESLRQQVILLRGHLSAIRKNAIKRNRYWVENMADQALAATARNE